MWMERRGRIMFARIKVRDACTLVVCVHDPGK